MLAKSVRHTLPRKQVTHVVRPTVRKISAHDLVQTSHYVGEGIILFTMFYCSMNWWYYKRTREDLERRQDNDDM